MLVTLWLSTRTAIRTYNVQGNSFEKILAGQIRSGMWTKVYYRVVPHYAANPRTPLDYVRPTSIEIEAIEVRDDLLTHQVEDVGYLHVDIPNFGTVTKDDVQTLPYVANPPSTP